MAPLFHMEALLPSSISPKINSILHSHIYPQVGHVFRTVAKFKSLLLDVVRKKRAPTRGGGGGGKKYAIGYRSRPEKSNKRIFSKVSGFMKLLRFNWAAAATVTPARARDLELHYHPYYYDDSTWNVVVPAEAAEELRGGDDGEDCGYLCWLEEETSADALPVAEEGSEDGGDGDGDGDGNSAMNEIDRLAERFIARCHAKFLLEKQESYRRYQEMMARSI